MERKELSLQEIQAISLEILKQITDLCEELHLCYALVYGTLIGAVRHHGYIPWDDDVDIMMPRPDYDKLLQYLSNHKLPNLTLFNRQTCPAYPYMISRISDDRYILEKENEKPVGMGIFIDIYPFDGLGQSKKKAIEIMVKGDMLSSFCYQSTRKHFAIEDTTSIIKRLIKLPMFYLSKIIGKNYFQNKLEKLVMLYDYESSKYVGCTVWNIDGKNSIYCRSWFDETIFMPFEKYKFRVPKQYDTFLRYAYGNYMQLPPENERIGHHFYKVYQKAIQI